MSLIDEVAKLRELRKNLRSLDVDGCSLLYPDGDEAARCRGDLGNDESTSGTDLAESLCRLHNLAPAMLAALGCFREGDAATLANIAERFTMPCPDGMECETCKKERDVINRLHDMAALMEKEGK